MEISRIEEGLKVAFSDLLRSSVVKTVFRAGL